MSKPTPQVLHGLSGLIRQAVRTNNVRLTDGPDNNCQVIALIPEPIAFADIVNGEVRLYEGGQ